MGAQRLGAKALRRIERTIGEPVLRGWASGGYTFGFVTPDHRHGWWNKKDQSWGWYEGCQRYTSCWETWPESKP